MHMIATRSIPILLASPTTPSTFSLSSTRGVMASTVLDTTGSPLVPMSSPKVEETLDLLLANSPSLSWAILVLVHATNVLIAPRVGPIGTATAATGMRLMRWSGTLVPTLKVGLMIMAFRPPTPVVSAVAVRASAVPLRQPRHRRSWLLLRQMLRRSPVRETRRFYPRLWVATAPRSPLMQSAPTIVTALAPSARAMVPASKEANTINNKFEWANPSI